MAFDINNDPNYTAYLQRVGGLNAFDAQGLAVVLIQYLCFQATQGATLSSTTVANIISSLVAVDENGDRLF